MEGALIQMAIQWPLLIFSLLAGCGGATLAFAGLSEVLGIARESRLPAAVCAFAFLVVGGCASVLHLGQPGNIMAAAANIFSFSGISIELIMLGANVIVAIVYIVLLRTGRSASAVKAVGIIGIVTGVLMTFAVGNGYVMEAQPEWNTIALPLAYLGSGLACGGTLFESIMVAKKEEADALGRINPFVLGAAVAEGVFFLAFVAIDGFPMAAMPLWVAAIAIGAVVPIVCCVLLPKSAKLAYAACAGALVGGIAFRALMWVMGTGFLALFQVAAVRGVLGL